MYVNRLWLEVLCLLSQQKEKKKKTKKDLVSCLYLSKTSHLFSRINLTTNFQSFLTELHVKATFINSFLDVFNQCLKFLTFYEPRFISSWLQSEVVPNLSEKKKEVRKSFYFWSFLKSVFSVLFFLFCTSHANSIWKNCHEISYRNNHRA